MSEATVTAKIAELMRDVPDSIKVYDYKRSTVNAGTASNRNYIKLYTFEISIKKTEYSVWQKKKSLYIATYGYLIHGFTPFNDKERTEIGIRAASNNIMQNIISEGKLVPTQYLEIDKISADYLTKEGKKGVYTSSVDLTFDVNELLDARDIVTDVTYIEKIILNYFLSTPDDYINDVADLQEIVE